MKYVVLINGPASAGKDTFVKLVHELARFKETGGCRISVRSISAVDRIKCAASDLGWRGEKDDKSRAMLSDLKDLADKHLNATLNYIFDEIDSADVGYCRGKHRYATSFEPVEYVATGDAIKFARAERVTQSTILFVCVREPKDARAVYDRYANNPDVTVTGVYISRTAVNKVNSNHADVAAQTRDSDLFPYLIRNDGSLGDLMNAAEQFVDTLLTYKMQPKVPTYAV